MKKKILFLMLLAAFSVNVFADRPLEKSEVDQLLKDLTAKPVDSWITHGTITAQAIENGYADNITEIQLQVLIDQRQQEYADPLPQLKMLL